MAVRPNLTNYGCSRCKRFLGPLQRSVVCSEKERRENRVRESGFMPCHPKIRLPFSILHLCYLSLFHWKEKKKVSLLILHLESVILCITHVKFLMNMRLAFGMEWLQKKLLFFKRHLENWYISQKCIFLSKKCFFNVKWNYNIIYILLLWLQGWKLFSSHCVLPNRVTSCSWIVATPMISSDQNIV